MIDFLTRRVRGDFTVDPWGLDTELHDAALRVARLRWSVTVEGAEHVPDTGPALLVVQRRVGVSEQPVVAVGLAANTNRRVRSAGIPGVALVEAPLRRLGAALSHPDEVAALLRDGHVVSIGLGWSPWHDDAGPLAPAVAEAAAATASIVLPVAVRGREWGRRWRVTVGRPCPIEPGEGAAAARTVREAVRALLEVDRVA